MNRSTTIAFSLILLATRPTPTVFASEKEAAVRIATKQSIEAHKKWVDASKVQLDEEFQRLNNAIESIESETFQGELHAITALKRIVPSLRAHGERFNAASGEYLSAMTEYRSELKEASAVFSQIAVRAADRAKEQKYRDLRQFYSEKSDLFAILAKKITSRAGTIEKDLSNLDDGTDYIEHLVIFLRHFEDDLESIPDFAAGESLEELVSATKRFVTNFQRLRRSMRTFSGKLGEQPKTRKP